MNLKLRYPAALWLLEVALACNGAAPLHAAVDLDPGIVAGSNPFPPRGSVDGIAIQQGIASDQNPQEHR